VYIDGTSNRYISKLCLSAVKNDHDPGYVQRIARRRVSSRIVARTQQFITPAGITQVGSTTVERPDWVDEIDWNATESPTD
jgi:hypothetical protein